MPSCPGSPIYPVQSGGYSTRACPCDPQAISLGLAPEADPEGEGYKQIGKAGQVIWVGNEHCYNCNFLY